MRNRLTQKQETFCLKYFELGNATEAGKLAGYSPHSARFCMSRLLTNANIQQRLQELGEKIEDATIANVLERKQILTEIARGRLTDFMECGQDGSWINIDPEKMNTHAIQAIDSKTEYDENGAHPMVVTKIRLHSPIQAITELNKMENTYGADGIKSFAEEASKLAEELTDEELVIIIQRRRSIRTV